MRGIGEIFEMEFRLKILKNMSNQDTFNKEIRWMRSDDRFTLDDVAKRIEQQHEMIDAIRKYEIREYGTVLTEYEAPV